MLKLYSFLSQVLLTGIFEYIVALVDDSTPDRYLVSLKLLTPQPIHVNIECLIMVLIYILIKQCTYPTEHTSLQTETKNNLKVL